MLLFENERLSEDVRKYRHLYQEYSTKWSDLSAEIFEKGCGKSLSGILRENWAREL